MTVTEESLSLELTHVHSEWMPIVKSALAHVDQDYLTELSQSDDWLPGKSGIFNAFSQPLSKTHYLLLGESPYPRKDSANGYAFWDARVGELWSDKGLSKTVNRATSLRNMIKMLLHARGDLSDDFSQASIARLDKSPYVRTLDELFNNLLDKGFLLLNASLVLSDKRVGYDAKQWKPFMHHLLAHLEKVKPSLKLLLFGKIAQEVELASHFECLVAEHPYNISFITNPRVLEFFKPLDLLNAHE